MARKKRRAGPMVLITVLTAVALFSLGSLITKLYSWVDAALEAAVISRFPGLSEAAVNGWIVAFWVVVVTVFLVIGFLTGRKILSLRKIRKKIMN